MNNLTKHQNEVQNNGFTIVDDIYTSTGIESIISAINSVGQSNPSFRKTSDLFAIRRFLKEIPAISPLIFNEKFKAIIKNIFGDDHFLVKSIYFDKPEKSNWFVAWHQDLTIAVDNKLDLPGYGPWTVKFNQYAVQPPIEILQNSFTIRIHLDDTDTYNGALKVIPGSHLKNLYRAESINWDNETENICKVKAGGIMIMRPLLLHASNRTTTDKKRRVIHLEFSKAALPEELNWAEKASY